MNLFGLDEAEPYQCLAEASWFSHQPAHMTVADWKESHMLPLQSSRWGPFIAFRKFEPSIFWNIMPINDTKSAAIMVMSSLVNNFYVKRKFSASLQWHKILLCRLLFWLRGVWLQQHWLKNDIKGNEDKSRRIKGIKRQIREANEMRWHTPRIAAGLD